MISVKGIFENGAAHPEQPVEGHDGQSVIITFLDEASEPEEREPFDDDWEKLRQLLEDFKMDTGIPDLAHQHDHYLYGSPKRP